MRGRLLAAGVAAAAALGLGSALTACLPPAVGATPVTVFRDTFTGPVGLPSSASWTSGSGEEHADSTCILPRDSWLDGYGHLVLRVARRTAACGTQDRPYEGAEVTTRGKRTVMYPPGGQLTVSVDADVPSGAGGWFTFWTSGATGEPWPTNGEIDVAELRTGLVWSKAAPATGNAELHGPWPGRALGYYGLYQRVLPKNVLDGWHRYWMTWRQDFVQMGVDTDVVATFTPAALAKAFPGAVWAFNRPMYLRLSYEVGGFGGAVTAATPTERRVHVDDVTVTSLASVPPGA